MIVCRMFSDGVFLLDFSHDGLTLTVPVPTVLNFQYCLKSFICSKHTL